MKLTESHNLSGDIRDAGGVQTVMLCAGYSARTFSLTVETLDAAYVAEHRGDVQAETEAFIREAIYRASGELAALPLTSGAERRSGGRTEHDEPEWIAAGGGHPPASAGGIRREGMPGIPIAA